MRRRTFVALLLAIALPLLLLAAVMLVRAEIALLAFDRWLGARGLQGSVAALHIGWERVEIHGLRIEDARARRVELQFEPLQLLRGELPAVLIEGLDLPLDLTGEGPPLGPLQPLLGAPGEPEPEPAWRSPLPENPPALPPLRLQDARLLLATAAGPLVVLLQGEVVPGEDDGPDSLALSFTARDSVEGTAAGRLDAALQNLRPQSLDFDLEADLPAFGLEGRLAGEAPLLALGEPLRLSGGLQGSAAALAALVPALPPAAAGAWEARLEAAVILPPLPYLEVAPPDDWVAWAAALEAQGDLALAAEDLRLPGLVETASLAGAVALDRAEGGTVVTIREQIGGELQGLDPALLAGLPPALAERLQPGASLSVGALPDRPLFRLRAGEAAEGGGQVTLALPDGGRLQAALTAVLPWPPTDGPRPRLRIEALEIEAPAAPHADSLSASGSGTLAFGPEGAEGSLDLDLEVLGASQAQRLLLGGRLQGNYGAGGALALTFDLEGTAESSALAESLRVAASGEASGSLPHLTAAFDLDVAANAASASGATAEAARLTLPLQVDYRGDTLALRATGPGMLMASALRHEAVEPVERVELALDAVLVEVSLDEEPRGTISLEGTLLPLTVGIVGAPGRVQLRPRPLRLEAAFDTSGPTAGLAELGFDSLVLPDHGLTLAGLRLELPLEPEGPLLRVLAARLRSDAAPAQFPPLDLTATLQRDFRFEARARGLSGALDLRARGRHDLERRRGEAELTLAPLRFAPDGLQPEAFGSLGEGLWAGAGSLEGRAGLLWTDGGFDGNLRASGSGLHLRYDGMELEGLEFDFALAGLQPLRTAAPQRVAARRIAADPSLPPITDMEAFVQIQNSASGQPNVMLEQLSAGFADGRLALRAGSFDPYGQRYAATLDLERLDLTALLALLGLDELTGSGRVSGSIPLEFIGGAIAVRSGLLQGEGEGVIAFTSPDARSALASGGEAVSLMFDALEDFHYDVLEIGLDKAPEGQTDIRLRLLGANPEVLDGHPFDLNINLDTNAAPLLSALAEGRRIQQGVMQQLWRLVN